MYVTVTKQTGIFFNYLHEIIKGTTIKGFFPHDVKRRNFFTEMKTIVVRSLVFTVNKTTVYFLLPIYFSFWNCIYHSFYELFTVLELGINIVFSHNINVLVASFKIFLIFYH